MCRRYLRRGVEASVHRFHCWFTQDDEYDVEDYLWTYVPIGIVAAIISVAWFIVQ